MNNKTDHWQQHVGSVWASLLSKHSLNSSGTIIEIGPGFTDKIGRGLAKLQFQGKLYVLEPNELALEWVAERYQTLLPNATIIAVNKTVQDACTLLPSAVEAVLMNHVLDDMVLHAGLPPAGQQNIFSQTRPGESCLSQVKETWQALLADPQYLLVLKQQVVTDLNKLIDHTDARIIGMSQYKSWFLSQNELEEADMIGNKLLGEMMVQLGDTSMADKDILRSYGQDHQDWLIIERETVFEISDNKPGIIQQAVKIKV
jgi:hypothetical protein